MDLQWWFCDTIPFFVKYKRILIKACFSLYFDFCNASFIFHLIIVVVGGFIKTIEKFHKQ